MQIEFDQILDDFKKKSYKPVYFLCGEESYFIDEIVGKAESSIIPEESKEFSLNVFYGRDITIKDLCDTIRMKTFFGGDKLTIVKEAQEIKDKEWEAFIPLLDHFPTENIVIICYKNKKPDGRLAWSKKMKDKAAYFESKELKEYQLNKFVNDLCQINKVKINPDANQALVDMVGTNLKQLQNEIEKLSLTKENKEIITREEVLDAVGVSREFNSFEYQKALTNKDYSKLYFIAQHMQHQLKATPLIFIIGTLYSYFSKLWIVKTNLAKTDKDIAALIQLPFIGLIKEYRETADRYRVAELFAAFELLREYDLKSKGYGVSHLDDEALFMEMTLRFIYADNAGLA